MIIFSQNKDEIFNLDNSSRVHLEETTFGEYEVIISTMIKGSSAVKIGVYKDKDSAKTVLRNMVSCVQSNKDVFYMPDYDGFMER